MMGHRTRLPDRLVLRFYVQFLWCRLEIPEEDRAEPAVHWRIVATIPLSATFLPHPGQFFLVAGEWRDREQHHEALLGFGMARTSLSIIVGFR